MDDVARPVSTRSVIAYWCVDSVVFDLEALKALREGDKSRGVRCILLALAAAKLAAEKAEEHD